MVRTTVFAAFLIASACGVSQGSSTLDSEELASAKLDTARRLWFAPNVGARDTLRLFSEPDTWPQARERLGVFQFYAQNLAAMEPAQCGTCNDVLMPNLEAVDAFRALAAWDVAVAFEMGAVKHHTCDGGSTSGRRACASETSSRTRTSRWATSWRGWTRCVLAASTSPSSTWTSIATT